MLHSGSLELVILHNWNFIPTEWQIPISFSLHPLATSILFSASMSLTILDSSYKWNHASKRIKYFRINFIKEMKNLHTGSCKIPMKEINTKKKNEKTSTNCFFKNNFDLFHWRLDPRSSNTAILYLKVNRKSKTLHVVFTMPEHFYNYQRCNYSYPRISL